MTPFETDLSLQLGAGWGAALLLALLLGLRHATDADHLAALATIAADPARQGARAAAGLGLAWSLGHAVTCFGLGLAVVAAGTALPAGVRAGAEVGVGLLIIALAARLLARWRSGRLHSHEHRHGGVTHRHPHLHENATRDHVAEAHRHAHGESLGRSPLAAFGIGLVHGVGGSALGAALLASSQDDPQRAVGLLVCFCAGTVLAMGGVSAAIGLVFDTARSARTFERLAPVLAVATGTFGAWYVAAAFVQLLQSP